MGKSLFCEKTYNEIQHEAVEQYHMKLNPNSSCPERMHVHLNSRMICKWDYDSTLENTFDLFHEIGHCQTNKPSMRRCEQEYYASIWAVTILRFAYGITIHDGIITRYASYIDMEKANGIKHGGKNYDDCDFTEFCRELYQAADKMKGEKSCG